MTKLAAILLTIAALALPGTTDAQDVSSVASHGLARSIQSVRFDQSPPLAPRRNVGGKSSYPNGSKLSRAVCGAVIGGAVGAGLGYLATFRCNCDDAGKLGVGFGLPLGAAVGGLIGAFTQ